MLIGKFNKVETGYEVLPNFLSSSEIGKLRTVSVEYRPEPSAGILRYRQYFHLTHITREKFTVHTAASRLRLHHLRSFSSLLNLSYLLSRRFISALPKTKIDLHLINFRNGVKRVNISSPLQGRACEKLEKSFSIRRITRKKENFLGSRKILNPSSTIIFPSFISVL